MAFRLQSPCALLSIKLIDLSSKKALSNSVYHLAFNNCFHYSGVSDNDGFIYFHVPANLEMLLFEFKAPRGYRINERIYKIYNDKGTLFINYKKCNLIIIETSTK